MQTPLIYKFIHFVLGVFSFKYHFLFTVFIMYQLFQWILGVRFFGIDCIFSKACIQSRNSLTYTMNKIGQFLFGFITIWIIDKII